MMIFNLIVAENGDGKTTLLNAFIKDNSDVENQNLFID